MPTQEKVDSVQEFRERLDQHPIAVATRFIGINAEQATILRKKLRDQGVKLKVYKNTLVQRVLDESGHSDAARFMEGPTAWAFSADPVAPAKILRDYNKDVPLVEMRGAILEGRVVSKEQLEALADLPSREVLIAQAVGVLAAPLRNLLGVLQAPQRDLVNLLEQVRKKQESGEAA